MPVPDTATSTGPQVSQVSAANAEPPSAGGGGGGTFDVSFMWESVKGWTADAWEEAQSAALARQQAFEEWQERHWRSFEERVQRRLGDGEEWRAWQERQRQRWGELAEEGEQLVRREMGAFEEWQQRYWRQHNPQASQLQQPASPSFRLSYCLLPLLPSLRSTHRFGQKTKMGIVGEMRDTGTKLAGLFNRKSVSREPPAP